MEIGEAVGMSMTELEWQLLYRVSQESFGQGSHRKPGAYKVVNPDILKIIAGQVLAALIPLNQIKYCILS
ncbi:uncharacterized protein G2W53_022058 [Senna tora]|uniref:Uncharacterized protein n=1 Tax=Senna tora TaxID=362788 RepID=A0A834TMC6_9FABA|nr:uncharacterized protein G2W53_022058 [Senna tora]